MKKQKWTLMSKQPIGFYMSNFCRGPGWGNPGYYHVVYELVEQLGNKIRIRVENGRTIRDYGEGYSALCELYRQYFEKAKAVDEGRLKASEDGIILPR